MAMPRRPWRLAAAALSAPLALGLAACADAPPESPPPGPAAEAPAGQHERNLIQVQAVFDRNARSLVAIYNRRTRTDATIRAGRLVYSFGIAPDGSVTHCELVSSTFDDPEFEQKILQRITQLDFGAQDVPPFEVKNYPINFYPM